MRTLGIDPGSLKTGFGIIENSSNNKFNLITAGLITLNSKLQIPEKLRLVHESITNVIIENKPEVAAIEGVFFHKNAQSAFKLAHIRGVLLLACVQNNLDIYEYSPAKIKKSVVGSGAASKEQVQKMISILLNLNNPLPSDAADALAIAMCHSLHSKIIS